MTATASEARQSPASLLIEPQVLTVLGTYRCTAACANCCFDSSPQVNGRLTLDEITSYIEDAARYESLRLVVFSGGECFLLGDDLARAIEFCASKGIMTRCVTNGYWAKSLKAGRRILGTMRDAGLSELNVSTGDFHQQWVAEETVVNAASLGVELGLEHTLIVVEMGAAARVTMQGMVDRQPALADLIRTTPSCRFSLLESPWMPMHLDQTISQAPQHMLNRDNVQFRKGCHSVFTTIVVTPHRRLGYCCGLTREKIPELNAPWTSGELPRLLGEGARDFMKIWLFIDGPERILAWAAAKNAAIDWENRYAHHCQACWALYDDPLVRSTIAEHYRERVNDVLVRYTMILRAGEFHSDSLDPRASAAP